MASAANIIYLEHYVESTSSLPPELQRMLNLIKSLDERCQELSETLSRNVERCNQLPPQGVRKNPGDYPAEYTTLMKAINDDQAMLKQLAEEKVQVAHQAFDLLDLHSNELNRMLEAFEAEYAAANPIPATLDTSDMFGSMDMAFNPKRMKPEPWEAQLDMAQLGPPSVKRGGHKGRRDDLHKRKSNMMSQYAQSQDEFDFLPEPAAPRLINTIPPGMLPAAPELQRPGRILGYADISTGLRGRLAEVWWPDDNSWYLIEIQDVNTRDLTADIMYVTGETEQLDLREIVEQQHMSLISL